MLSAKKFALVTGAGSGIGRCVALALSREGYAVALAGRRREPLEEAARLTNGAPTLVVPADIAEPSSVGSLFRRTLDEFGRLDLLFNNAGVSSPAIPFEELTVAQWNSVIDTNLRGAFLCAREAFRIMKNQLPQGGRIINNGSLSAHSPRPLSAPYTASKHGVTGLTRSILLDGRRYGIVCGQIDIGNAASEMTEKMRVGVLQANLQLAPEPVIDPEHIARAVVYMASLPLEANTPFMTVMASQMPYFGRG